MVWQISLRVVSIQRSGTNSSRQPSITTHVLLRFFSLSLLSGRLGPILLFFAVASAKMSAIYYFGQSEVQQIRSL